MKLCDKDKETSNTRSKQMKSQMSVEAVTTALQVNATAGNGEIAEHKVAGSLLLFFAELLETSVAVQRIPFRIEP